MNDIDGYHNEINQEVLIADVSTGLIQSKDCLLYKEGKQKSWKPSFEQLMSRTLARDTFLSMDPLAVARFSSTKFYTTYFEFDIVT